VQPEAVGQTLQFLRVTLDHWTTEAAATGSAEAVRPLLLAQSVAFFGFESTLYVCQSSPEPSSCLVLSCLVLLMCGAVRQEGRRAQLVYCYSEAWLQVGPSDAAVRTHDKSSYVLLLADLPCVCCEPVLVNHRLRITFF
jgi:hypothetical protein